MRLEGRASVALPRERVFAGLQAPALLRASTPGLVRLDETQPGHFEATLELKLPAISGRFEGSVDVLEREAPARTRYRLKGKGAPGFVDGSAEIELSEAEGGHTGVRWAADVTVGGPVARLGQRMISGVAKEMAAQFFETFEKVAAPTAAGETGAAAAPLPPPPNPFLAGLRLLWRLFLRAILLRRG